MHKPKTNLHFKCNFLLLFIELKLQIIYKYHEAKISSESKWKPTFDIN